MFRKKDVILIACICLAALLLSGIFHMLGSKKGNTVNIMLDGALYGSYPLDEDRRVEITENDECHNVVVIEGGMVYMEEADCPDKYCIRQGKISHVNETIVCLPHKLVVEIKGGAGNGADIDSNDGSDEDKNNLEYDGIVR